MTSERRDRIRSWSIPTDAIQVRPFFGAIKMTLQWVNFFSEIRLPSSRLTENVEWKWDRTEQFSFQLLQEKCAKAVDMHGWDFRDPTLMYCDASRNGTGFATTQF